MNTHTHTLSYYCKRCSAVLLFLWRFDRFSPLFLLLSDVEIEKDIFVLFKKRFSSFCTFRQKKEKSEKQKKIWVFHPSIHVVYSSSFFFFFSASEILNTKHHQRKGENEKARAHITATTHEHRKCLSSLRLIVPSCTHSPRNTTSSQKEKEKEEE